MKDFNLSFFLKSTAVYSVMGLLPLASRFILFPIFIQYIPLKEYGIIGLSNSFAFLGTVFIGLGLPEAFARFYFEYKSKQKLLNAYLTSITLFIFVLAIFYSLLGFFLGSTLFSLIFSDPSYGFNPFGYQIIISSLLGVINGLILLYFRNAEKIMPYFWFSLGIFCFSTLLEILCIFFVSTKASQIIWFRIIGMMGFCIPYWFVFFRKIPLRFDARFLKSSFIYAGPIVVYLLLIYAYTSLDRIFIEKYLSLEMVGVYGLAIIIASIVEIALQVLDNVTTPNIYSALKEESKNDATTRVNFYFRISGYIALGIGIMVLIASQSLLPLFIPKVYIPAIKIIPLLIIAYIARYFFGVFNKPLFYYKKTTLIPLINLTGAIFLVISAITLIPDYGLKGAALSVIIARYSMLIPTLWIEKHQTKFDFQLGWIYPLSILTVMLCLISYYFYS